MKIEHLAKKIVAVLNPNDPVDLAIRHMWRLNIRHLPVVKENIPVGMVSERDVLFHVCWLDHMNDPFGQSQTAPASGVTRVEQIMSKPIVSLSPDDSVETGARVMLDEEISAIPLVKDKSITGIVTEADFLRCFNDSESLTPSLLCRGAGVTSHMSASVFSVRPGDSTNVAVRLMADKNIHHLAVTENDDLMGIVSDRDLLRGGPREVSEHAISAWELRSVHEVLIGGLMTQPTQTMRCSGTLAQAANLMATHKIGAVPIVENGNLSGIISETDLLRAMVHDCET